MPNPIIKVIICAKTDSGIASAHPPLNTNTSQFWSHNSTDRKRAPATKRRVKLTHVGKINGWMDGWIRVEQNGLSGWETDTYYGLMVHLDDLITCMDLFTAVGRRLRKEMSKRDEKGKREKCEENDKGRWNGTYTSPVYMVFYLSDFSASNTSIQLLTPSVVPVITWSPSYVDLMYIPCIKTTRATWIKLDYFVYWPSCCFKPVWIFFLWRTKVAFLNVE